VSRVLPATGSQDLSAVVADRHVIVCTGPGGVGKTTAAASLALGAAARGRRTIVLTIDPARRLAQSLGLGRLDNRPRPVAGVDGLDAMMLDMKRTFDEVIDRHASDAARAQRIKTNRFYRQMSSSLAGTQEYMAMEKLYDLHSTGGYDCIVIDTPPTRNALDFLDAPRRLTDFLEGRFLKMFLAPGMVAGKLATRAAGFGAGLFMRAASRITGQAVLGDLAEFFQSFEGMYEGFKDRAQAVYHLLQQPTSAFVVVASAEDPALREARFFLQRLESDGMPTAGLVVNRVTPPPSAGLAAVTPRAARAAANTLDGGGPESRAAAALLRLYVDRVEVAERERRAIAAALHGVDPRALVQVPLMATDVVDLPGLTAIGRHLYG
jgi:anion-transporting  ArsA/GET3 family ATPase